MWTHTGLSPREGPRPPREGLPQEGGEEQSVPSQTWHGLGQVSCFLGTSVPICLTSTSNYAVWGLPHSRSPWHLMFRRTQCCHAGKRQHQLEEEK